MNVGTAVKAGGLITVLAASVIGLPGGVSPVEASARVIHATGTQTLLGADSFELAAAPPNQCVLDLHQTTELAGTLDGANSIQAEIRWFAPCDEVFATTGPGIVSTYHAVGHYVGVDGKEATLRYVGRTDAAGDYQGIIAVQGDLNGALHQTGSIPLPGAPVSSNYDGILVDRG
jgi:hypothetical protein